MNDNKNLKNKWLHLRLSEDEYAQLQKAFKMTTERKLSKYARQILLGKPMIRGYRNLSMDALMIEFIQLNKSLNGIANNYNQSIHKLHTLDHYPQVILWLESQAGSAENLLHCITEIRALLRKMSEHDSRN